MSQKLNQLYNNMHTHVIITCKLKSSGENYPETKSHASFKPIKAYQLIKETTPWLCVFTKYIYTYIYMSCTLVSTPSFF